MFIEEFEKCNEDDVYITSDNEVRLLDSHSDSSDEAPAKNAKFDFEKFIEVNNLDHIVEIKQSNKKYTPSWKARELLQLLLYFNDKITLFCFFSEEN